MQAPPSSPVSVELVQGVRLLFIKFLRKLYPVSFRAVPVTRTFMFEIDIIDISELFISPSVGLLDVG